MTGQQDHVHEVAPKDSCSEDIEVQRLANAVINSQEDCDDDQSSKGLPFVDKEQGDTASKDASESSSVSLSPHQASGSSTSRVVSDENLRKNTAAESSSSSIVVGACGDERSKKRFPSFEILRESPQFQKFKLIMTRNWIPDNPSDYPFDLSKSIENSYVLKLLKFWALTILAIMCDHWLVRDVLRFGNDRSYGIDDFFKYDLQFVSLEAFVYFVVGRLHLRNGVDVLFPFILPMMLGMVFPSIMTEYFMEYSLSMYDIMCRWPPHVFLFVSIVGLVGLAVIGLHLTFMYRNGTLCSRLFEIGIIVLLFGITPTLDGDNFHPHHWFISWLLGMQANQKDWWSLMTIAFMWGYYINGISSWGRDSVFGCSYSHYLSTKQYCDYMDCQIKLDDFWYINDDCWFNGCDDNIITTDDGGVSVSSDSPDEPSNTYGSQYLSYRAPDWRTCNVNFTNSTL